MNQVKSAFLLLFVFVFVLIGGGCGKSEPESKATLERLTLQLHWIPDSHQIGFWTALDKGFYKSNGLEVVIHAGGLDANPIKDVLGGSADIGQVGGVEQVCVAASEGLPIKAIAAIHRETPHALISLSSNPIKSPSDFKGKTIAVAYGDTAELLLRSYMVAAGVDESTVKLVPFKYDLTPLLSGQVDAITGFSTGQPATLEKMGRTPVMLTYSSAGVSSYGYTLVVSDTGLKNKPIAIKKFLNVSREGWEYAFAHPEEAVSLMRKRFRDAIDEALALRELSLIEPLMVDRAGHLSTWKLDEARVDGVLGFLQERGQLKGTIAASSVYTNELTQ